MSRVVYIDPSRIKDSEGHTFTAALPGKVLDIASKMLKNQRFKPVVTRGPDRILVDGRHRTLAARSVKKIIPMINVSDEWFEAQVSEFPPVRSLEDIANIAIREFSGT